MSGKKYGKDISSINTPIKFHLPDGNTASFKTSAEAQKWFDQNYADRYSMEEYVPQQGDAYNPIELQEVVVTAPSPNKTKSSTARGIDMFAGANYSPRFNKAYNRMGMNPLSWTKYIPKSYWDSETHKNVVEGGNIAAGTFISTQNNE